MVQNLLAFFAGLLFALGLALSQMTDPNVVIGFLDVSNWDPTLCFVMVGAIGVHALPNFLARRSGQTVFGTTLHEARMTLVNTPLVVGAVMFGAGWGLAGYCPGPAVVSAAAGGSGAVTLCLAMVAGMMAHCAVVQCWKTPANDEIESSTT